MTDVATAPVEMRALGRSGLQIAPLMLGGNVFDWTADEATSHRVLDAFADAGCNAIDTAEAYSAWVEGHTGGESETVIGNWLARRGRRDEVVIATKVGWASGGGKGNLSAQRIAQAAEASLKRLRTDYIDLYQAHSDDAETPIEETLEAFGRLIEQGKVRAIGASNFTAARLKAALDVSRELGLPRYESLQPAYNLYDRSFEQELRELCVAEDVGVISYYGLASGFLTGKYRSEKDIGKSVRGGRTSGYLNERGFRILKALDEVAGAAHATLAEVALAWIMAKPGITAPIASATSVEQVHELLGALRVRLDTEAMRTLDEASA